MVKRFLFELGIPSPDVITLLEAQATFSTHEIAAKIEAGLDGVAWSVRTVPLEGTEAVAQISGNIDLRMHTEGYRRARTKAVEVARQLCEVAAVRLAEFVNEGKTEGLSSVMGQTPQREAT